MQRQHPKNVIDSQLEKERWEIIQQSNIDFQKFGWVIEISKLFGISTNRGGKYIRKHFPEFYKTCYIRKPYENKNQQLDLLVCEQIKVLAKPCPTDSYIIQFIKTITSSYKKKTTK